MTQQYALVTSRASSTRLPGKCFQKIAGDLSVIQVVIRRALKIGCPVILATTEDASDDPLEEVALAEGVECFRGAVKNKIHRWHECFRKYAISEGLLVDGDDPTFNYDVGFRALQCLQRCKSDLVTAPPEMTPGFITYGITMDGMKKLYACAEDPSVDTDIITGFIEKASLTRSYVDVLPNETAGHDLRLTVDYPEDVEFYRELYRRVDYLAPSPDIVEVALENSLQRINWHRQQDYLENQRNFHERMARHG